MNVSKKTVYIVFNAIFFIAVGNFIFNTIITSKEISDIKCQKKIVMNQIEDLKIKKEQKQKELISLNEDKTIEKIARDKLNMKKSGEVIYRFVNE